MVGTAALVRLLGDDSVAEVVAPTRRPLPSHPKLMNPITDSITLPQHADWWSVDGAVCALGTTRSKSRSTAAYRAIDYDYALAIATRVREGGARGFALVTSMGADARSWFLYTRTKGELEEAVERLGFPSLTMLRPGFLGGDRDEHRMLERELATVLRILEPVLPAGARTSPASTVARLLVEAALVATPGRHVIGSAEIARAAEG